MVSAFKKHHLACPGLKCAVHFFNPVTWMEPCLVRSLIDGSIVSVSMPLVNTSFSLNLHISNPLNTFWKLYCFVVFALVDSFVSPQIEGLERHPRYGVRLENHKYKNMHRALREIFYTEGWPGLYKGIFPSLLKSAPAAAVTFVAYEYISDWLESLVNWRHEFIWWICCFYTRQTLNYFVTQPKFWFTTSVRWGHATHEAWVSIGDNFVIRHLSR